ncbi:MAG: hypothetical protein LBD30_00730 [Verrucomicrobiales bacterium]|nr:hypothetical protein [Verrucomicrobiales bacterium]
MKKYIVIMGVLMASITTSFAQRLQSFAMDSLASEGSGGSLQLTITLSKTQLVMLFASHYSTDGSGDIHYNVNSFTNPVTTYFDIDGVNYGHYSTQLTAPDGSGSPRPHSGSGYYFLELAAGTHTIKIAHGSNEVVTIPDYRGIGASGDRGGRGEIFAIELGESVGAGAITQADLAALETSLRQAIAAGDTATATTINNALTTYQSQVQITVNNLQSQIDALNINKDTLASQIAALEQQSNAQSALLAQLQQSLATTQQDLANLTSEFSNLSALLNGLAERVTANEQAIANLRNSLMLVNNQLIAYGLRLDEHGALLFQLGVRLDEHGNLLDSHGNLIAKLTTQLNNQGDQLKKLQKKLDRTAGLAWVGVGMGSAGAVSAWSYMLADDDREDDKCCGGAVPEVKSTRPGFSSAGK